MVSSCIASSVDELMLKLGRTFQDVTILELACIHKSYGNERRASERLDSRDNERLEFLGDAILDLLVSQMLLTTFPDYSEGDLSKLRASLVNEKSLVKIAKELNLGRYILLGKGEELTGGREKDSILASTFEAIVAAVFIDGGFSSAEKWIETLFRERIKNADFDTELSDYKTKLQEIVQARFKTAPYYEVIQTKGPDHDKVFEIRLLIGGKEATRAFGKNKKEAEQNAAKEALKSLS